MRHGFCEGVPSRDYTEVMKKRGADVDQAEHILRFFHVTCGTVVEQLQSYDRIRFLGNLDKAIASDLLGKVSRSGGEIETASGKLEASAAAMHRLLVQLLTAKGVHDMPPPCPSTESEVTRSSGGKATGKPQTKPSPKMILYDGDGHNLNQQDVLTKAKIVEHIDFAGFMASSSTKVALAHDAAKAHAVDALWRQLRPMMSLPASPRHLPGKSCQLIVPCCSHRLRSMGRAARTSH